LIIKEGDCYRPSQKKRLLSRALRQRRRESWGQNLAAFKQKEERKRRGNPRTPILLCKRRHEDFSLGELMKKGKRKGLEKKVRGKTKLWKKRVERNRKVHFGDAASCFLFKVLVRSPVSGDKNKGGHNINWGGGKRENTSGMPVTTGWLRKTSGR